MIDELHNYRSQIASAIRNEDDGEPITTSMLKKIDGQALTAIYEIGLECIGAAEEEFSIETPPPSDEPVVTEYPEAVIRNDLRASQRKAWAKACGVAEK